MASLVVTGKLDGKFKEIFCSLPVNGIFIFCDQTVSYLAPPLVLCQCCLPSGTFPRKVVPLSQQKVATKEEKVFPIAVQHHLYVYCIHPQHLYIYSPVKANVVPFALIRISLPTNTDR